MRSILFCLAALCAASCGAPQHSQPPDAAPDAQAALSVRDGWAMPTPGGVDVSAGYVTIVNATAADDRLVAASSPRAARVEVHEMTMDGGVMRMRPVEGGVAVPAGGAVTLAPGGEHLMFFGVSQPFTAGESIPLTLTFAGAGDVSTELQVRLAVDSARNAH